MTEWKKTTLEQCTDILGDGLHGTPIYDSNGEYAFINGNNLINGKIIIKPDTKRVNEAEYQKHKKPLSDRTVFVSINGTLGNCGIYSGEKVILGKSACYLNIKSSINKDFIFYIVSSPQFKTYLESVCTGTTIKNVSLKQMREYEFWIPDMKTQNLIVSILSSLDKKININKKINENLLQQAQALFKSWFLDYDPWDGTAPATWTNGNLGDFADIKRGASPRPIQEYLSESGLRWLKISDVTSLQTPFVIDIKDHIIEEGLKKTVFLKAGSLVLSNSATPGIPKILDVDSCIHDGWLYFPESKFSVEYLYLYFKYIRQQLVNLSNGSVFNNLKTDILKEYPTVLPDEETLRRFDDIVKPMFLQMQNVTRESHRLAETRDAILPRLMSGELDVSNLEL